MNIHSGWLYSLSSLNRKLCSFARSLTVVLAAQQLNMWISTYVFVHCAYFHSETKTMTPR